MSIIRLAFQAARIQMAIHSDPIAYARSVGVNVGSNCRFLGVKAGTFGSEPFLISIGDHVTITSGVRFVTHDGGVWVFRQGEPDIDVFGPIRIGSNVFIGINSIVMPGATIGSNCVIGAGSVVTRDIPEGTVAAGVPAKILASIDEYCARTHTKSVNIGSLDASQKRHFLESKYPVSVGIERK